MRYYLALAFCGVAAALLGWYATVWATPRLVMQLAHSRMAETAGGYNQMLQTPPVTAQNQRIVRQSPDLLYSACAFNLDSGPVSITVGETQGYWSASFFDAATNNFQTVNSDTHGGNSATLTLVRATPGQVTRGATIISPTARGVVLIRRRIKSDSQLQDVLAAQSGDACSAAP